MLLKRSLKIKKAEIDGRVWIKPWFDTEIDGASFSLLKELKEEDVWAYRIFSD